METENNGTAIAVLSTWDAKTTMENKLMENKTNNVLHESSFRVPLHLCP